MTSLTRASSARLVALVLVTAAALAAAGHWFANRDDAGPAGSSPTGWTTVTHEGVRVQIPASWERLNMDDCEFAHAVWRPPDLSGCDWAGGMMIVGDATFDPAHGPGVRRVDSPDEPAWGGYAKTKDSHFAVVAGDDDRMTVMRVLQSVS